MLLRAFNDNVGSDGIYLHIFRINSFEEIFFFPVQRGKNCFKHFESFLLNLSFCSVLLKAGIPTHSFQSRWTFCYLTLLSPLRYFRNSVLCKQTFESRLTGSIISRNVLAQFGCIILMGNSLDNTRNKIASGNQINRVFFLLHCPVRIPRSSLFLPLTYAEGIRPKPPSRPALFF